MPEPQVAQIEANKAVIRRYYEFLNGGDPAILDEIISPNYIEHKGAETVSVSAEELRERSMRDCRGVPDLHYEVELEIGEGEYVVTFWRATGQHTGEFMGIPATGKYASVTGITIERVVDGKITEARNEWDRLGALQQLGVIPA
jgi:steroid delta-isomerase-like uncharacterized protein